ncbi:hypothetical protein K493DRAFT_389168, partial [Basidiobolus meristosporus CBS 931.73]
MSGGDDNDKTLESESSHQNAPLFELVRLPNRLMFENVYLNGLHTLRRFAIKNISDNTIVVKLRSNLGSQVAFQLKNENFPDLEYTDAQADSPPLTELPLDFISNSSNFLGQYCPQFNEVFNYVDYVSELTLSPEQSQEVVLVFLPEEKALRRNSLVFPLSSEDDQTFDFNEVQGHLFFIGHHTYFDSEFGNRSTSSKPISHQAEYIQSIRLRARICKSVLWCDVGETGINFDDCVAGETYFKDFSIANRSEIPLSWSLSVLGLSNTQLNESLVLTDYDSGEPIEEKPLPAYSYYRIRVTFKPQEAGDYNYVLQLENENNSSNVMAIKLHAQVGTVAKEESLVMSSGNVLDFGDCYGGIWAQQKITLKNVGDAPLEVHFSAENAEVLFSIVVEEDATHSKREGNLSSIPEEGDPSLNGNYDGEVVTSGRMSMITSTSGSPVLSPTLKAVDMDQISESDISEITTTRRHSSLKGCDEDSVTSKESFNKGSRGESEGIVHIDELILRSGREKTVVVSYKPKKDESMREFKAGELTKRTFKVILQYSAMNTGAVSTQSKLGTERKVIQCKSRSCTSFVDILPKEVNFGDTNVGILKSVPIQIVNLSELPAKVQLRFTSKVLSCLQDVISIPAKQSVEVKLDIKPRKVNPDYRKQVNVVNLQNRDDDQFVQVKSVHVDQNGVTFHSLFYRTLLPNGTHYLDFGDMIINSPKVKCIFVENISRKPLTLEMYSSLPNELVIYTEKKEPDLHSSSKAVILQSETPNNGAAKRMKPTSERREKLLEEIGDRRVAKKASSSTSTTTSTSNLNTSESHHNGSLAPPSSNPQDAPSKAVRLKTASTSNREPANLRADYLDLASPFVGESQLKSPRAKRAAAGTDSPTSRKSAKMPNAALSSMGLNSLGLDLRDEVFEGDMFKPRIRLFDEIKLSSVNEPPTKIWNAHRSLSSDHLAGMNEEANQPAKQSTNEEAHQERPVSSILQDLEKSLSIAPPLFPGPVLEEKFVKNQMDLRRDLNGLVHNGLLVESPIVEIPPNSKKQIILVFTPKGRPNIQGVPRKYDSTLFVKLVEFDREIYQPHFDALVNGDSSQIPVREVPVRSSICRTIMDLGQKNINFGLFEKGESRERTMVIRNRCEAPLLFGIRKSGSIASGDIGFENGRYGVVRGYGKREVKFVFEPSLAGRFYEKIVVRNVQDRSNDQTMIVKAQIRKPFNFFLQSSSIDFGPCLIDQASSKVRSIVISNTNKHARLFEIHADVDQLKFGTFHGEIIFEVAEDSGDSGLVSQEVEEQIESMEQKIKIARRKGRDDKVKKLLTKIEKLKRGEPLPLAGKDESSQADGDKQSSSERASSLVTSESKSKKSINSIIFSVAPRSIQTISVYFKPYRSNALRRQTNSDLPSTSEVISGQMLVHEHKNTDVCKHITFRSIVCSDYYNYVKVSSQYNDTNPDEEAGDLSGAPFSSNISEFWLDSRPISTAVSQEGSLLSSPTTALANPFDSITIPGQEQIPTFSVDLFMLDVGKVEIGQKLNCYVTISNQLDKPLVLVVKNELDSHFLGLDTDSITLEANDTRRFDFKVIGYGLGVREECLTISNVATGESHQLKVRFFVHRSQYLCFPSLSQEILDLGYCYVDPGRKYSQITPLLVENISDEDIYITCQSNLAQQVHIFLDEKGERGGVNDLLLTKHSKRTVWVALQPNLLSKKSSGNDSDDCRTLIGGLKFSVKIPVHFPTDLLELTDAKDKESSKLLLATQTVRFTSLIGQSSLAISHKVINLGSTKTLGEVFYGSFTLKNLTARLPAEYRLECPSGCVVFDRTRGNLDARLPLKPETLENEESTEEHDDSHLHVKSQTTVTFRVTRTQYGLFKDFIDIVNVNNSAQVLQVEVRLFVDPGQLHIKYPMLDSHSESSNTDADTVFKDVKSSHPGQLHHKKSFGGEDEVEKFTVLYWKTVYVSIDDPKESNSVAEAPKDDRSSFKIETGSTLTKKVSYSHCLEIHGLTNEAMHIVPRSDLELSIDLSSRFLVNSDDEPDQLTATTFPKCGPTFRVDPGQKVQIFVNSPNPQTLSSDALQKLKDGKKVKVRGILVFENILNHTVVGACEISAYLCVSKGMLNSPTVDLGKIGYVDSWKVVNFSFDLVNTSDCLMYCSVANPSPIEILRGPEYDSYCFSQDKHIVLKPYEKKQVQAILKPRRIQDYSSGHREFVVAMSNIFNPSNKMLLNVKATLTSFELNFDRLTGGQVVLPILQCPSPADAVACDSWFSITNSSEEDVRFELGVDLDLIVSEFITVEVLSRFSNSPLTGAISLSPLGSIEVRVRAFSLDTSELKNRLTAHLSHQDGVSLGRIWVATLRPESAAATTLSIAEHIPIRGTIVEGPTFSLSNKHIEFKTFIFPDNEEGNPEGEDPDPAGPASSTDLPNRHMNLIKEILNSHQSQEEVVSISNLMGILPLRFKVQIEAPSELPIQKLIKISPLDDEMCGVVAPGGKLDLSIQLLTPLLGISDDLKILVYDLDSVSGKSEVILVGIVSENCFNENKEESSMSNCNDDSKKSTETSPTCAVAPMVESPSARALPRFYLRGCKRVETSHHSKKYLLDLGQQDVGSNTITKKLTIENISSERLPYKIKTISSADQSWIAISQTDGILETTSDANTHTITLNFMTGIRNIYSTYLVIENLLNPADTKTVRITMEVVAKHNVRRAQGAPHENRVFDVFVNGLETRQSVIHFSNLFYYTEYTTRSFVVYNYESVPLEFSV